MSKLIKLISNGLLKEHPFTAASPDQNHSYIYPGDEIVLYHFLALPSAAAPLAASIDNIKLISARTAIIAQKPQVFSEEFSQEFKSTRNFTLDEFVVTFNNGNAPVIPWGSDGYAPMVMIEQDRAFRLPPGDFRRQIKFTTTHIPATSSWNYLFRFPVLFRWEYWLQLLTTHNDFFDVSLPHNGKNNWWYRYYKTLWPSPGVVWTIKSRLELHLQINLEPVVIRSEIDLTPNNIGDLNDYGSAADWINESIKTSILGGAPTNTPCLINKNQDTSVFGYFEKVLPWLANEQGNISAVVWIEPFEGSGVDARTRASSLYPVGSESAFAGLQLSLTDDSGTNITTSGGQYIVIGSGNGAIVLFDGVNPENVRVFSIIDHTKLALIYPGVTKFTLYVRLYNVDPVSSGSTKGEEIKQEAILISIPIDNTMCERRVSACPFNLDVFATMDGVDDLKNDKSDFYQYGDALIDSISFTLQKNESTCGDGPWKDKAIIIDNEYGKFFALGLSPDFFGTAFIDDYGKRYTGLWLYWWKVLVKFGAGIYRIKIIKTDILSSTGTDYYDDRIFCLKEYHCNLINGTVRIETLNEGLRGTLNDNTVLIDYGTGWHGQWRLKGVMKIISSTYVTERNQYGDADYNAIRPIINEQHVKYMLSIRPVPGRMDHVLSTDILQADEILITDYNEKNRHTFIKTPVMIDGDFTPSDNNLSNPLSMVNINMAYAQNNLRKRGSR